MKLDFPLGCLEGSTVFACPAVLKEVPLPCLAALEELWTDPALWSWGWTHPLGMAHHGISSPWQQ